MKKILKMTAAALAAAVFLPVFTGCSFLRPIDGTEWEETTDIPRDTTGSDVTGTPDDTGTSAPDTTSAPETTAPPAPREKRASVLAVGDNIIHEAVYVDAKNRATGEEYDFATMYAFVNDRIGAADVAFINHETPLAGDELGISGYPTFNAPRLAGRALVSSSFDVVNLANNHIMDKRISGARATVEYVRSLGLTDLGVYLDQEDYENIRVTEVNGIRIGWVAFSQDSNNAHDNKNSSVIFPRTDDDNAIISRIKDAAEVSDFVIVSAHWGLEQPELTSEQKRLAQVMTEAGADVILGHHSHILQPVEWLTAPDGSKTLVAYSLGNFLSAQLNGENMIGGMLTFDVVMDEDGKCALENPVMEIVVNHYDGDWDTTQAYNVHRYNFQMYMLEDYAEDLAAKHGCRFFTDGFGMDWIDRHVRSIIDAEFLPAYFDT